MVNCIIEKNVAKAWLVIVALVLGISVQPMSKAGLGPCVFSIRTDRTVIHQLTISIPSSLSVVGTLLYLFMTSFNLNNVVLYYVVSEYFFACWTRVLIF